MKGFGFSFHFPSTMVLKNLWADKHSSRRKRRVVKRETVAERGDSNVAAPVLETSSASDNQAMHADRANALALLLAAEPGKRQQSPVTPPEDGSPFFQYLMRAA